MQVAGPTPARLAAAFRAADRNLGGDIRDGFRASLGPLDRAMRASALAKMPSGYGPTLAGALVVKGDVRASGRSATATIRVSATSAGGHGRDVGALNDGLLKHPVWGRVRRTRRRGWVLRPWVAQPVPPRFGDDAVDEAAPAVDREMAAVLDRIESRLAGA